MKHGFRRPSPSMAIALAALFFALGGAAVAAIQSHYVITSTKQIKPSVLKKLKAAKGPRGAQGPKGSQGVAGAQGAKGDQGPAGPLVTVEAWHEVGAVGEPAFTHGWDNNTDTGDTTTAFYKDPFEVVHMKGAIADQHAIDGQVFVLPSGDRPTKAACFPTIGVPSGASTVAATYLCVFPDGSVNIGTLIGDNNYVLDGITFRAGTG